MRGMRAWAALAGTFAALAVLTLVYVPVRAQNVSALPVTVSGITGSVSLPTGAATAAKQPALGTAGTASSDAITVQGITGMTPLFATGAVAHGSSDSGNPLKIGAKATTSVAGQTPVTNNQRTDTYADADGVQLFRPQATIADIVKGVVGVTDGSSTSLIAAQGSGVRFCATTLVVSNSSATNVTVDIRDGTAGSVIQTIPAAANMGGAVIPMSIPLCTSANTAMAMDPSAAATTITVSALGFKTKL